MSGYVEVWGPTGPALVPLTTDRPMSIGRAPTNDVVIGGDGEVSRVHAVLQALAGGWCVRDLTSRNGTFVNGERIRGERPVHDGDEVRVGRTRIMVRLPAGGAGVLATSTAEPVPDLTRRERDVLHALFLTVGSGEVFTEPASTRQMADALFVSEAAVKQHLANLYDKFAILDSDRRRLRLANEALRRGAVRLDDLPQPSKWDRRD
jgi:predicted component of type VI protein secretion system